MNLIDKLREIPSLISTLDNAFTVKDHDKFVHSSRFPLKEAERLLQNIPEDIDRETTIFILWGVGLGYHAEILLNKGYQIIAIETRPSIATIFKKVFPIDRLIGFIEQDDDTLFDIMVSIDQKIAKTFIDVRMLGYEIPNSLLYYAEKGKNALRSTHTIYKFLMESWYNHIIENLSLSDQAHIGVTRTAIFEGQTVIICSAGPSLKESLPYLKRNQDKAIIIATDTALMSLVSAGIIPDYVHSVDAKIHNIGDFSNICPSIFSKITLIADITLSPQAVKLPWKHVLFTSTAQPIAGEKGLEYQRIQLLDRISFRFPELQTGGSVANSAFHLALTYKAKKILLIGQDLAYSNNRGHAVGTPYDTDYRSRMNRLNSLYNIHIHKIPFENPIKAWDQSTTWGDPLLNQFRQWFETSVYNNPSFKDIVINASEFGAYFKFWTHIPLSSYQFSSEQKKVHQYLLEPIPVEDMIEILSEILEEDSKLYHEYFYREHCEHVDEFIKARKLSRIKKNIQRVLDGSSNKK